jgi:hypothetical protein
MWKFCFIILSSLPIWLQAPAAAQSHFPSSLDAKLGKGSKQKGASCSFHFCWSQTSLEQLGFWNPIAAKSSTKDNTV